MPHRFKFNNINEANPTEANDEWGYIFRRWYLEDKNLIALHNFKQLWFYLTVKNTLALMTHINYWELAGLSGPEAHLFSTMGLVEPINDTNYGLHFR
jgi:hypothetical protein